MLFALKAPDFWYPQNTEEKSTVQKLLQPVAKIYGIIAEKKFNATKPYKSSLPVVCLGNVVAGGAGKTPCAITVFKMVQKLKLSKNPCFLIRGYGGKIKSTLLVDPKIHAAKYVGDEAFMLSQIGPVIVSPNREKGAKMAEESGFDMIIMDDGYQNPGLHKDIHILVVDARGFGNHHLIPAGPLREPVEKSLERADIILFTGEPNPKDMDIIYNSQRAVYTTYHKPIDIKSYDLESNYIGFAGIGNPEKFKLTLQMNGFNLIDFKNFGDHHVFTEKELKKLTTKAKKKDALLITTHKDYVRLPQNYKNKVNTLKTTLKIVEKQDFKDFLKTRLHA